MAYNTLILSFVFFWVSLIAASASPVLIPRIEDWQKNVFLDTHNQIRSGHGANALTWSDDLAGAAQAWVSQCQIKHYDGDHQNVGENLVATGTTHISISKAVEAFASDKDQYVPGQSYLHFTQVVWKNTTEVGCAVSTCPNLFEGHIDGTIYACLYNPQGNIVGSLEQNVQV